MPALVLLTLLISFSHREPDHPGEPVYWGLLWIDLIPTVRKWLRIVDRLAPEDQDTWREALLALTPFLLARLVLMLQSYVFTELPRILDLSAVPPPIQHAIRLLKLLYEVNTETRSIPVSLFQCSSIFSERVDLKADYRLWRKDKEEESFHFVAFPFLFDTATKARLVRVDSFLEMVEQVEQAFFHAAFRQLHSPNAIAGIASSIHLLFNVRREQLMEDTESLLDLVLPVSLRKPLKLQFEGEDGLDQGGVQKEYFQLLLREIFVSPTQPLWTSNTADPRLLWFGQARPDRYELVGKVVGLAVYNGVIVDLPFPPIFYRLLIDPSPLSVTDLFSFNSTLFDNMEKLLQFEGDVEAAFSLDFTFAVEWAGRVTVLPLLPNGENIPVTSTNRKQFADLYAEFAIRQSVQESLTAFLSGFFSVMNLRPLTLFAPSELETLICGLQEVDLEALGRAAHYEGFSPESAVVAWFWEVVAAFEVEERKALLAFVTGSDRVPVQGLDSIAFIVQRDGPDTNRLPTSRTCFGILLLPEYSSKAKLENRLKLAISNSQGFGLI